MLKLIELFDVLDFDEKILILSSKAKVLYLGYVEEFMYSSPCPLDALIDCMYVSIIDGECITCIRLI